MADDSTGARTDDLDESMSSRRGLLRNVALGAAGVAAAGMTGIVAGAGGASADDGDPLTLGQNNTHATRTNTNFTGANVASSFTVESGTPAANNDTILNNSFANAGTAFIGIAASPGPQKIGVIGWSRQDLGTGIVGFTGGGGAYGGEFFGGLAEIRLRPNGTLAPPPTLTNAHQVGELYEDADGTLWLNVGAGSPGVWRELGGPSSSGAFHAISPQRVYDSRPTAGKLAANEDRTISVAASGGAEVVPAGATAVAMTFTVTDTEGAGGFVSVRPAGSGYAGTSSINWFGAGQNLATTVISALGGDRQLALLGGVAATHVVVDITGFYR